MRPGPVARRLLYALRTGPRAPRILFWMIVRSKPGARRAAELASFKEAIGELFLGGWIVARGRTSGRVIAVNGRRSK